MCFLDLHALQRDLFGVLVFLCADCYQQTAVNNTGQKDPQTFSFQEIKVIRQNTMQT